MLKYRVWDKIEQKFIYPVIDITNDFHQKYPKERFVFDKFIYEKDGVEYFENDLIEIEFANSNNWRRCGRKYLTLISPHHLERGDWALYRLKNNSDYQIDFYNGVIDNTYRQIPQIENVINKLGNIHQNFDILKEWYLHQTKK